MLIFRILFGATFIAVVWTDDKNDLKIINNEEKLRQTMKEIREMYEEQGILTATRVAFSRSGLSPIIGVSASLIPILIDAVKSSSSEEALAKVISDGAKREIVKQEIRKLGAIIVTIDENIKLLESGSNLKRYRKKCIVLIMHNALKEFMNDFANSKSIFREYATLALQPLFALAAFIAVYDPLEKALYPALGSLPISCKLFDILLEYRSVAVRYRFARLEIYDMVLRQNFFGRDLKEEMLEVLDRPFNEYGYNRTDSGTILCEFVGCGSSQKRLHFLLGAERFTSLNHVRKGQSCLVDRSSGLFYHAGETRNSRNCILGYMELLRHRIEEAFKEPLDLVDLVCPEGRRKQRNPTGYGWLAVNIEKVTTTDIRCDIFHFLGDRCDPYVKIIIDGKEVHKTEAITNTDVAFLIDTYNSHKIRNSTKMIFEVWDKDGGLAGDDERLFCFETDIPKLLEEGFLSWSNGSSISTKSVWRDDYE